MSLSDRGRRVLCYNQEEIYLKTATGPFFIFENGTKVLDLGNHRNLLGYGNPLIQQGVEPYKSLPALAIPYSLEIDVAETLKEVFPWVAKWVFQGAELQLQGKLRTIVLSELTDPSGAYTEVMVDQGTPEAAGRLMVYLEESRLKGRDVIVNESLCAFRDEGLSFCRRFNIEPDFISCHHVAGNGANLSILGLSRGKHLHAQPLPDHPAPRDFAAVKTLCHLVRHNHNYHPQLLTEAAKNFFGSLSTLCRAHGFWFEPAGCESVQRVCGDHNKFSDFARAAYAHGLAFTANHVAVGYAHLPHLDMALTSCRDILCKLTSEEKK